ncbi:hypothetical protein HY631_04975 [Candidatus Uhrbacteria bacterium]|nr:hypothetical protein [Candidatus Uhrbacteria bacterium]
MQNYDQPAKNWVRSWYFSAIDRLFPRAPKSRLHAVYFPGVQNLEGPHYAARGITAHPVERDPKLIRAMRNPRLSLSPLTRKDVFVGTLGEWAQAHACEDTGRIAVANADFEGKLESCADEIIKLFRVFPSRESGLLCVTTFANLDADTVASGVVFGNALDSLLEGCVRSQLSALNNQLQDSLENSNYRNHLAHAQFCRDFGLLWRVLMGLALFTSPEEEPGVFLEDVHGSLVRVLGGMHQTAERLQGLTVHKSFSFFQEPRLTPLLRECATPIFPLSLSRALYQTTSHNRMTTWLISFGRLRGTVPLTRVADQLWQLYAKSPLTVVSKTGRVRAYQPR